MNKLIKNILNKIESNGYEAYLIGGYVRDLLVGKDSYDIDICTNATPRELVNIFPNSSTKNLGGIDFKIKEYHFEITTYRIEKKYCKRRPVEFNYVNNLIEDLQRRDFTVNAICMNSKGQIIDLLNGTKDIVNMTIKMIGNIEFKIKEDPLRILRAIRIATILNFTLDSALYKIIKENNEEILSLSSTRIKEELDKILLSDYVKNGLNLLEEIGITKLLKISDYKDIVPVKNLEGMYAQIKVSYDLPFTKIEKTNIDIIKKIVQSREITKMSLYKYGLYFNKLAGEILNINPKAINKMYKELPIKERKDINITVEEILKYTNIENKEISSLLNNLEELILNDKLKNKKGEIIKYLKSKRNE